MGYDVPAKVASGEKAIEKAGEINPDVVLMDIKLEGNVDGVEAVKQIYDRFDIPSIYLTAYADEETLNRAKITEPNGYIIKPFEDRELHANIQMTLYKHKSETERSEASTLLKTINNELERKVEERTIEVEKLLKQKDEVVKFLRNFS